MRQALIAVWVCFGFAACRPSPEPESRVVSGRSTSGSIRDAVREGFRLHLSREQLGEVEPSARSMPQDFGGTTEHREAPRQDRETLVSRETLADGAVFVRTYVVEGGRCSCAAFGWQIPNEAYTSSISGIVAAYRIHFAPVQPERRVKRDPITKEERPCLVWALADRLVVLDWTSLGVEKSSDAYGLIQLVVMDDAFAGSNRMERILRAGIDVSVRPTDLPLAR